MTLEEFQRADLRVAKILVAERVAGSEKLVRLEVDAGDRDDAGNSLKRQLVAGVGRVYAPENLIGREVVVIVNLEPRKLMGIESNGMLLAASDEDGEPVILSLDKEVAPGAKIQ